MKKSLFSNSALFIAAILMTFCACSNEENNLDVANKTEEFLDNQMDYHYILNGVDYTVVMRQKKDSTYDVASPIDPKLSAALNQPNSTLLTDPFNKHTYYVFETEEASKEKNAELIQQMNKLDKEHGYILDNKLKVGCVLGQVCTYVNINFDGYIDVCSQYLEPDVPLYGRNVIPGGYNDQISSYKVWSNTYGARSDGKRFVLRFYQDSNYGGHVLTAYSFFVYWTGNEEISWQDDNLHNTLMQGGWRKKYWGDQISSYEFRLE